MVKLDERQEQAVEHNESPLLVLAGPGSGKTRVLCHRIATIAGRGTPRNRILALTFTRKAANEMRERLQEMMSPPPKWVKTFHSLCVSMLRTDGDRVGLPHDKWSLSDGSRNKTMVRRAIESLRLNLDEWEPGKLQSNISLRKNRMIDPRDPPPDGEWHSPKEKTRLAIHIRYNKLMKQDDLVDYDDLLLKTVDMMRDPELKSKWSRQWDHVLVDEFQDTNLPQYHIMHALASHHRITTVGDPDQSIYGWRGAEKVNIDRFREDFQPAVVQLNRNYRSAPAIVEGARALMESTASERESGGQITRRNLKATQTGGNKIRVLSHPNDKAEATWIHNLAADAYERGGRNDENRIAVIYRINSLSRPIEERLIRSGLPYTITGGARFYDRKEIQDAMGYLKVIQNPADDESFERILNRPPRGLGTEALKKIRTADISYTRGTYALPLEPEGPIDETVDRDTLMERTRTTIDSRVLMSNQSQNARLLLDVIDQARRKKDAGLPPADVLEYVLDASGYNQHLLDSNKDEDKNRLDNLDQLVATAREYADRTQTVDETKPNMRDFLDEVALMTDRQPDDASKTRIHLMTYHAAKGLEFPTVVLAATEDGITPLKPRDDDHRLSNEQIQEERRLFYVGMTRSETNLYISEAHTRCRFGRTENTVPSRYITDIPAELREHHEIDAKLAIIRRPPTPIEDPPKARPPETPETTPQAGPQEHPDVLSAMYDYGPPPENLQTEEWEDGELLPTNTEAPQKTQPPREPPKPAESVPADRGPKNEPAMLWGADAGDVIRGGAVPATSLRSHTPVRSAGIDKPKKAKQWRPGA